VEAFAHLLPPASIAALPLVQHELRQLVDIARLSLAV
jgi:hypothetical protein